MFRDHLPHLKGQGDLASGFIMGIIQVTIWFIGRY